jgi:hypothetical protein
MNDPVDVLIMGAGASGAADNYNSPVAESGPIGTANFDRRLSVSPRFSDGGRGVFACPNR